MDFHVALLVEQNAETHIETWDDKERASSPYNMKMAVNSKPGIHYLGHLAKKAKQGKEDCSAFIASVWFFDSHIIQN